MRSGLLALAIRVLMLLFPASVFPFALRPRTTWPSSLTSHVSQGILRTVQESIEEGGVRVGVQTFGKIAWMVVEELLVFPSTMIPFALRTLLHRRQTMREVRCGAEAHQTLEVYDGEGEGPLVLYVHGGSWGQGAPWNYALLAARLLEHGASRVAVARYRLFPEGDVDDMVHDLSKALEWCEGEAREASKAGRHLRVTVAAQSAGAHLCALLFARRSFNSAVRRTTAPNRRGIWLPDRFVGLSGVFDIGPHFLHEKSRLVHWLSPMWLAMLGKQPTVHNVDSGVEQFSDASMLMHLFEGNADVIAAITEAQSVSPLSSANVLPSLEEVSSSSAYGQWSRAELSAWALASPTRLLRLQHWLQVCRTTTVDLAAWPNTVLLHAADDKTVPIRSAREFTAALKQAQGEDAVSLREYAQGGHGEVMLNLMGRKRLDQLPYSQVRIAVDFIRCTVNQG
ncbi:hypothetical protein AB1Y20_013013 [Prymnesium parvum]|uniref:BD-FAE-like domain-containing protein n=1 Tax=Prymnesium parvum TaxID=97485 RepID=A0AB34IJG0_PRYPA